MKRKTYKLFTIALLLIVAMVSCKETIHVESVKFLNEELALAIGVTTILSADVRPYSATDLTVTWTSDNTDVATVSAVPKNSVKGEVLGKSAGTAIITATTKDGGYMATCTIRVIDPNPEMIFVEGGTFTMGCTATDGSCWVNEVPPFEATLSSFSISKYTITHGQWYLIMGTSPDNFTSNYGAPATVRGMSAAQSYINRLNELTGKNYRLPTEAEWEYAARGGNKSQNYIYSGSNNLDEVGWFRGNTNDFKFRSVGLKKPNELGIYDMSGNIQELCSDWVAFYTSEPKVNPTGPSTGSFHIVRGGALHLTEDFCTVFARWSLDNYVGFRVVLQ